MLPTNLEAWRTHLGREFDVAEFRASLNEGTLISALERSVAAHPRKVAITVERDSIGFEDLRRVSSVLAGRLRRDGVSKGDRVLLCGANSLELVIAHVAVLRAGAAAVLVNPALTDPEIQHVLYESGSKLCFADEPAVPGLEQMGERTGRDVGVYPLVGAHGERAFGRLIEGDEDPDLPDLASEDLAQLAFTSGTTGKPKGVPLSHGNLLASIRSAMAAWGWSEDDVLVHALPLSHGHGLSGVHTALIAGSSVTIHARFKPERLAPAVEHLSATVMMAVPAIYQKLVDWEGMRDIDFSSLRLPISGSAPLSPRLAAQVAGYLDQLPLERYGTTESGLNVSNPYSGARKVGSVGLPLPGAEVVILDEKGGLAPTGTDGEILVRGPQVFSGYWGMAETGLLEGGWFRTGDIGRVDPDDGRMSITGRLKEMIISGGLNVYPREVELALENHPEVLMAAVVGVPSKRWGEEVVAFVVSADTPDLEEIAVYLRTQLAPYKCPKRILVTDDFPRNSMGKVLKSELARMLTAGEPGSP